MLLKEQTFLHFINHVSETHFFPLKYRQTNTLAYLVIGWSQQTMGSGCDSIVAFVVPRTRGCSVHIDSVQSWAEFLDCERLVTVKEAFGPTLVPQRGLWGRTIYAE